MNGSILFSEKLKRVGVEHGFTTRALGDVLGSLNLWEKETNLKGSSLVWLNQVHGIDVFVVDQPASICSSDHELRYDAAITNRTDVVLSVRTADCTPILLFSDEPRAVAVVHAGWRGTLAGIVTHAVSALVETYNCTPKDLTAAIGPCIQPCCYEVGEEVSKPFSDRFGSEAISIVGASKYAHLATANRIWLIECGLSAEKIETLDYCTCCRKELFFSYRREGALAGRQLAYISLTDRSPIA
ncbi:MAG: peptidoglycan editing factor PgeF [Deltaproteobacteria bacterium]|nr:peptidoglycan editing factor PgeF [Deltaproteobacteria bacterium]MBW1871419.1 peptidoglycan editing factor PgeF [Deltaproteobacteria bacterium]